MRSLAISPEMLDASRNVLRDSGNWSSATVLLILGRILSDAQLETGTPLVLMASGPGLTLYAALLRFQQMSRGAPTGGRRLDDRDIPRDRGEPCEARFPRSRSLLAAVLSAETRGSQAGWDDAGRPLE